MQIKEAIAEAHNTAKQKGFWDKPEWNLGEKLMLITSELGEALEADRQSKHANVSEYLKELNHIRKKHEELHTIDGVVTYPISSEEFLNDKVSSFKKYIKDSVEDELADAIIRLFDLAGKMNVDLEFHIAHKMDYNKTRDKLHGKKY